MALDNCPSCGEEAGGGMFSRNYLYRCEGCGDIVCSKCIKRGFIETTCPQCDTQINVNRRLN